MRALLLAALFSVSFLFAPTDAEARGSRFGLEDKFKDIQALDVPPSMRREKLGGKWPLTDVHLYGHYKIRWVFLGVYLQKEGYVLRPVGADEYLPLDDKMIADFQALSLLPKALPEYVIEPIEYVVAYSLWILLGGVSLWYGGKELLFGNRRAPLQS